MAVIMGIDPGSRVAGFGCIEISSNGQQVRHLGHGVIVLPKDAPLPERLAEIGESMQTLLLKYQPEYVVVEKIFLGKNADSAFKLGHARGVVLAECERWSKHQAKQKLVICEYAARAVKKAIGGSGAAEKEQVQTWVQHLLKLPQIEHIDASDALALALFHIQKMTAESRHLRVSRSLNLNP